MSAPALQVSSARSAASHEHGGGEPGTEFWAEVVHDLRSPLASILCLADALRSGSSGPVNERQRRQLELIYTAALGLARVTSDALELPRAGDELAGEKATAVSMAELLESVREIVQPMADVKGLSLRLRITAEPETRYGPALALSRALLNLTTNALKSTDEGTVEIAARPTEGDRVEFSVRDTGPGIDPAALDALSGSCQAVRGRNGVGFSRSGLGLAIACRLVRAMGGELRSESQQGGGTRFSFEIELPPGSAAPALEEAVAREE